MAESGRAGRSISATFTTPLQRGCEHGGDAWAARSVYDAAMSSRQLREDPAPGADQDVEPLYPEPEIELDVDTLE
jgi:hypothetical protein